MRMEIVDHKRSAWHGTLSSALANIATIDGGQPHQTLVKQHRMSDGPYVILGPQARTHQLGTTCLLTKGTGSRNKTLTHTRLLSTTTPLFLM